MSRDRSGLSDSEIEKVCQSLLDHRETLRDDLAELTGQSPDEIRSEGESVDLSEYETAPLDEDDRDNDDDNGMRKTATVKVTGGGAGNEGGAIAVGSGGGAGSHTGQLKECARCGAEQGLIGKYDIWLCRQCFREVARIMGFKKFK